MKCVELANTAAPTAVKEALQYADLTPAQSAFEKYAKQRHSNTAHINVGDRVATLGSNEMVYCDGDRGIFSAILKAYNNHWKLRTSPDDWWFCIVNKVSSAIDKNAENKAVRDLFVEHEGKKELIVDVPTTCIYDVDYRSVLALVTLLEPVVRSPLSLNSAWIPV